MIVWISNLRLEAEEISKMNNLISRLAAQEIFKRGYKK